MRPGFVILVVVAVVACRERATSSAGAAALATAPPSVTSPAAEDSVHELIGMTPPEWNVERWLNGPPRTLASLRGKVVLVRWWTAGCPYCSATAPALRALHRDYASRGLEMIGMYHHKEDTPFDPSVYEATARKYELTFPVAF